MLSLLQGFEQGENESVELMKRSAIIFVPLVNPDGVAMINEYYIQLSKLTLFRKNRHVYDK